MAKEMKFRGKQIEELKKLDVREFAKYIRSKERRYLLRNFDVMGKFIISAREKSERNKAIRTHNRNLVIVPQLIDMNINIHNGKNFIPIKITQEMLGHRLGEFVPTRQKVEHSAPGIGATRSSASASVK